MYSGQVDVHPTLTDRARLVQRSARVRHKEAQPRFCQTTFEEYNFLHNACRPFSGRRSRRSVRSGYAFAHSEGFGRLITSGRIMREVEKQLQCLIWKPVVSDAWRAGFCRLVVWEAVVARVPMGQAKSQEVGSLLLSRLAGVLPATRAMGQQGLGLVDLYQSWLFPLDKLRTSSLASCQTI